jgi:hypothetical protein
VSSHARSVQQWLRRSNQPSSIDVVVLDRRYGDPDLAVNIWLPHHVGYIQPAETIDTVNIATNNFDAEYGMAAGAASTVVTARSAVPW